MDSLKPALRRHGWARLDDEESDAFGLKRAIGSVDRLDGSRLWPEAMPSIPTLTWISFARALAATQVSRRWLSDSHTARGKIGHELYDAKAHALVQLLE